MWSLAICHRQNCLLGLKCCQEVQKNSHMQQLIDIDEFLTVWNAESETDHRFQHHADNPYDAKSHVRGEYRLIDVRSPSEFARGHIPGAANVPLFDDEQRANVGTLYKQQGRQEAVLQGLEFAGPKMRWLAEEVRRIAGNHRVLLHCWRGGMRSASMAWLVKTVGIPVQVLRGGYREFRRRAQVEFDRPRSMIILSGMTGAGKTTMLSELADRGEQTVDLEALANHRGSSFGGIGLPCQPTTEQFENDLFWQLRRSDAARPIWLEDESPSIGKVRVPSTFWWRMRESPALFLDVDRPARARNLMSEYSALDREQLLSATQRLQKKLGGLRVQQACEMIEQQDDESAALLLLEYYDKTYRHAAKKRPRKEVLPLAGTITVDRVLERAHEAAGLGVSIRKLANP